MKGNIYYEELKESAVINQLYFFNVKKALLFEILNNLFIKFECALQVQNFCPWVLDLEEEEKAGEKACSLFKGI